MCLFGSGSLPSTDECLVSVSHRLDSGLGSYSQGFTQPSNET